MTINIVLDHFFKYSYLIDKRGFGMFSELIIKHGLFYSAGFTIIILVSVLVNPRIWMQDFPDDLKSSIPPKSVREIRQTFITGFLFAVFIIGFPLYSIAEKVNEINIELSFSTLFLHSFSVMVICNIFYWILLDQIIFGLVISRLRTIPEIKKKFKFPGWKRQVFGLFIGFLMCGVISSFTAWIARLYL